MKTRPYQLTLKFNPEQEKKLKKAAKKQKISVYSFAKYVALVTAERILMKK
jgi:uncharacterized protein (DUF1778 family)